MKSIAFVTVLTLALLGMTTPVAAYEGGTKAVAAMNQPHRAESQPGPLLLVPHNALTPSKPVLRLLNRFPEPTLSVERIREEKQGPSLGTKRVVLFQKKRGF